MSGPCDEVVFEPVGKDPGFRKQVGIMATVFFVIIQVAFVSGWPARIGVTLFFLAFVLIGAWISAKLQKVWPQRIVLNAAGLTYGDLKARHGIDLVPWREVERMDLFYNAHNMAPFMRIALRPGSVRSKLQPTRLQRLSFGWDINVPVAVDAPAKEVLETAQRFWSQAPDHS